MRFVRGLQPRGRQFAAGTSRVKYNFPLAKTFCQSPYTTCTLCPVLRTGTVFFNATWQTTTNRCQR